ncbi:shikimate dehydrogenase family protein [Litoreibacter albidus]|uniref:shikimate dehydrogenase family protein n=1 Tax=Litoreibacter albidus TaxID=670155 RepID=UPI00373657EC
MIRLGLIGDNIAASKAPLLHETAGRLAGVDVRYDRLVPKDMGLGFDGVFDHARDSGFRGLNVTYPYKERAAARVHVSDPLVQAIGAVNTVRFDADGPQGFNTDYSGFMRAYRAARAEQDVGRVCLIGAGGVGKAVGFALIGLGATDIRCVDTDTDKATTLARSLAAQETGARIRVAPSAEGAAKGADGIINCTPLGMEGIGGTPLPEAAMHGASWAFDAVYTPVHTPFLQSAKRAGLDVISGYELFFGQGIDAWEVFTGLPLDTAALRAAIGG